MKKYCILLCMLLCINKSFSQRNDSLVYSLANKTIGDFFNRMNVEQCQECQARDTTVIFYMDSRQDYPVSLYIPNWRHGLMSYLVEYLTRIDNNFYRILMGDAKNYLYNDSLKSLRHQLNNFEGGRWNSDLIRIALCTDSLKDYTMIERKEKHPVDILYQKLNQYPSYSYEYYMLSCDLEKKKKILNPVLRILYPYILDYNGNTYGIICFIKYDIRRVGRRTDALFDEDFWCLYMMKNEDWELLTSSYGYGSGLGLFELDISNAYENK